MAGLNGGEQEVAGGVEGREVRRGIAEGGYEEGLESHWGVSWDRC